MTSAVVLNLNASATGAVSPAVVQIATCLILIALLALLPFRGAQVLLLPLGQPNLAAAIDAVEESGSGILGRGPLERSLIVAASPSLPARSLAHGFIPIAWFGSDCGRSK